jgi:TP901-1 family phage major tail protein
MAQKDGKLILVKLGSTTYAGQTDTDISFETDTIEVTTKTSTNGAKEYLPGEQGTTISFSGLQAIDAATDVNTLVADWKGRTVGTFVWGGAAAGSVNFTGSAFISSLNLTGNKNEGQGYSGTLQVTGDITVVTVS